MCKLYKFLLIEDCPSDITVFKETIKRLNKSAPERKYDLSVAKTFDEAIGMISKDFCGIIVDIKLGGNRSGNHIIAKIIDEFRTPVAIFTGTPDVNPENSIKVYKKGEASVEDIISDLCATYDTGLFNVLGGTGIIERAMTKIFWENLYPKMELWKSKKALGIDTEKILLRYAISHIQELIDEELPSYITEEMYIVPPIVKNLKTGSIVQNKSNKSYYIVLSPPCDLAIYNGKMKTDSILLCEIEDQDKVNSEIVQRTTNHNQRVKAISSAIKNNFKHYYHWLPGNTLFNGGYINFRKISAHSPEELDEKFYEPIIKIQEGFVKNILSRFSFYYSRQGQPDFDFEEESKNIEKKINKN